MNFIKEEMPKGEKVLIVALIVLSLMFSSCSRSIIPGSEHKEAIHLTEKQATKILGTSFLITLFIIYNSTKDIP